ncbi:MAG: hypothetical protein JJT99_09110 [Rhodobacteraceae bacterium]|nr:hypothetical protein [Paracoccaceae bacterium]
MSADKQTRNSEHGAAKSGAEARAARLKAVLKANIAKRKAQARAREQSGDGAPRQDQDT